MKRFLSSRLIAAQKKAPYHYITQLIDGLNYDFQQFELDHFLHHVAERRGRPIRYKGFLLSETGVYGFWLPREKEDYIAFNSNTYHIHHAHIILHEIGHMLLGHQPRPLEDLLEDDAKLILDDLNRPPAGGTCMVLTRSGEQHICSSPEEHEAEIFSTKVQSRVMRAHRFDYLLNTSTTIEGLRAYTDAMGFQE